MALVFCAECSFKQGGWIEHDWPPCDLHPDGSAKDPLPCGHRRPWQKPDGTCRECESERRQFQRLKAKVKGRK